MSEQPTTTTVQSEVVSSDSTSTTTTTTTTTTNDVVSQQPSTIINNQSTNPTDAAAPKIEAQTHHANGTTEVVEPIPLPQTIVDGLEHTVKRFPQHLAIRVKRNGVWRQWSWTQYRQDIYATAKAFIKLGLSRGGGINIIGFNSPEWHMCQLGAIWAGGLPTGIYTTSSPAQCEYFANHSEAQIICIENQQQLDKYMEIRSNLNTVKAFILMEPLESKPRPTTTTNNNNDSTTTTTTNSLPEGVYSWEQFLELGRDVEDSEIDTISKSIKPDDLCTLIYTSGTTGMPKGCMITQRNVAWTCHTVGSIVLHPKTGHRERFISYLPLSHVAEQVVTLYAPLVFGFSVSFADRNALQGSLLDTLMDVKPTIFFGVPRVWEKIQLKITTLMNQSNFIRKKLLFWAKGKGLEGGYKAQRGEKKPKGYGLARSLVFKKVMKGLGLDQCRFMASTAAPISKDTLDFFLSLGITVTEAYGMSELTGPQCVAYPRAKTGSVGKTLPGSIIRLNEGDNEICIKGPNCFIGYYKNPEATRETIDADGWVHTGDIGHVDENGYLFITDRKKELIITAGGENISPALLEGYMRQIPGVNHAVAIGDRQKYLVCLLAINVEYLPRLTYRHPPPKTLEEAIADKHFNDYLQSKIDEMNTRLPNVSTIKKFRIVPRDFVDSGTDSELTPTQKLKRKIILAKYDNLIREMYGDQYAEGTFNQPPPSLQQSVIVGGQGSNTNEIVIPTVVAATAAAVVVPVVVSQVHDTPAAAPAEQPVVVLEKTQEPVIVAEPSNEQVQVIHETVPVTVVETSEPTLVQPTPVVEDQQIIHETVPVTIVESTPIIVPAVQEEEQVVSTTTTTTEEGGITKTVETLAVPADAATQDGTKENGSKEEEDDDTTSETTSSDDTSSSDYSTKDESSSETDSDEYTTSDEASDETKKQKSQDQSTSTIEPKN